MKKEEYLNHVEQALKAYDKAYVDEIIRDYEEHFQNAKGQGKSEEEICESLGSPEVVIQEIQELLSETQNVTNEVARPFTETEKVPFQKFHQQEWHNRGDFEQQDFTKIRFQAGSADIKILCSKDSYFHLYTEDPSDIKYLEYKIEENTYYGRVCNRREGSIPGFNILMGFLGGQVDKVILEIPQGMGELSVESLSGDIQTEQIQVTALSFSTFSGDITAEDIHCQSMTCCSKSGDIEVKKVHTESMVIETISGDVRYKQIHTPIFTCHTTSGDVSGKHLDSQSVYVKTVSGDGKIHLDCFGEPYYACTKTISGDMKVKGGLQVSSQEFQNLRVGEGRKVSFSSVSGDCVIKAAKENK